MVLFDHVSFIFTLVLLLFINLSYLVTIGLILHVPVQLYQL